MSQAFRRLDKELQYFNRDDCEEDFSAGPDDESDFFHWTASFTGPENTPYEGGTFSLKMEFPKDYPFKGPRIFFETKVYHPNIRKKDGYVSLQLLDNDWSPDIRIIDILKRLQNLLAVPEENRFLEEEIAKKFLDDKDAFNSTAKEWTMLYAT